MAKRRLLGELMVASPLIMMLGMAIEGRTSAPTFDPYEYTAEQNEAIRAVRPYLGLAKEAIASDDPAAIMNAARNWTYAIRVGWLRPLKRANYYDSSRQGIKGEISETIDQLACELAQIAQEKFDSRDSIESTDCVCLALALTGSQKYADIDSIGYFSMRERAVLQVVRNNAAKLRTDDIKKIQTALTTVKVDVKEMLRCAATADRLYAIDGLRWNEARSRILDPFARSQAISNSARRSINKFSIVSLSRPLFDQANSIRYATASLESEKRALKELQEKLMQRQTTQKKATESR